MKKLLSCVLAVALSVVAAFSFGTTACAEDSTLGTRLSNSNTFYKYDAQTKILYINGSGDMPNLYNDSKSIPWYDWSADSIQSVVIQEGITSIGNYCFYQVYATSFSIPRSVKRIGRYALSCTNRATQIDLPFGVEKIDSYAFYASSALRSINIPNSVKTIGEAAFYNCSSLQSVVIPSSVASIGKNCFYRCTSLTDVTFASLTQSTTLSLYAFIGCTNLKSVNLPSNLVCASASIGYATVSSKVDGVTFGVFKDSSSYYYALDNGFDYVLLDAVPVECGVAYTNTFNDSNINDEFHYTFTPAVTQEYTIYSVGGCDTYARLYREGELIAENDDIDQTQNGFCIKTLLEAGISYDIYVSSVKMTGTYTLYAYPAQITGFGVYSGSITKNASDGNLIGKIRVFEINESMFENFILDLSFADGTTASAYYCPYLAGEHLDYVDNQYEEPFACGRNDALLTLGELSAKYDFVVEHSYAQKEVAPTEDDDGYTLNYCINCDDSFKENFVATTSFIVTGRCVMDENDFGAHPNNVAYPYVYITVDGRRYDVNPDGTWAIRTFEDCYITFNNLYGGNAVKRVRVSENGSYDFGVIALEGYDLNKDGYVNAKDYVIYYKYNRDRLGEDYWQFGDNFLIWQ